MLGFVPRIVLASLSGYLVGQFLNAYVVVKIKERTKGGTCGRLIGSTVVGEFADTALFASSPSSGCSDLERIDQLRRCGLCVQGDGGDLAAGDLCVIRAIKKREPGYAAGPPRGETSCRQMRLVVAVEDYDRGAPRDELASLEETYDLRMKVMILGAGRALELSNRPQIDLMMPELVGR